jgi:hypothetical protein
MSLRGACDKAIQKTIKKQSEHAKMTQSPPSLQAGQSNLEN